MKKIFAIILAMFMMFSMSTMAFAGTDAKTESVDFSITFVDAENAHNAKGEKTTAKFYDFAIKVDNHTKKNINLGDYEILAVFIDDTTYDREVLGAEILPLGDVWVNAGKSSETIEVEILKDFEGKTIDIKTSVNGLASKDIIKGPGDVAKVSLEKIIETTTATTVTTTVAPTETTTEAPTETTTEATTTTTTAPTYVEDTEETGGDDYVEAPVEDDIPNTGSAPIIGAVAALGLAAGALILLKKKNK